MAEAGRIPPLEAQNQLANHRDLCPRRLPRCVGVRLKSYSCLRGSRVVGSCARTARIAPECENRETCFDSNIRNRVEGGPHRRTTFDSRPRAAGYSSHRSCIRGRHDSSHTNVRARVVSARDLQRGSPTTCFSRRIAHGWLELRIDAALTLASVPSSPAAIAGAASRLVGLFKATGGSRALWAVC